MSENQLPPVREAPTPTWMIRGPRSAGWQPTAKDHTPSALTDEEKRAVFDALAKLARTEAPVVHLSRIADRAEIPEGRTHRILLALAKKHRGLRPRSPVIGYWTMVGSD